MFYGEPSIRGKDDCVWDVVRHTMHGLVVETIKNGAMVRGLVDHNDARAYKDGHLKSVRIFGEVKQA